MGAAADTPPSEAPTTEHAAVDDTTAADGPDAAAGASAAGGSPRDAPVFTLEYPRLWIRGSVLSGPNPLLLAQLFGAVLALFTFAFLYIGVSWNPGARLHTLSVAVLSCDAGVPATLAAALPASFMSASPMGTALLAASVLDATTAAGRALGWRPFACGAAAGVACGASAAPACRAELVRAVERGDVWSALYVPPSFTADVLSGAPALAAAMGRNASTPTLEHIYGLGRSPSTYTFIKAAVSATASGLATALGRSVLGNAALSGVMGKAWFIAPLVLTDTNLHPVVHYGQNFASYVFCVLLWMGSAFTVALLSQFRTRTEIETLRGAPATLRNALRTLTAKACVAIAFAFVQAIALVSVLLCLGRYQADGPDGSDGLNWAHSPGLMIAYAAYMSFSFAAINALALHTIGVERFTTATTLFLIVQLTSSAGFFSETLSNRFFLVGRGLPFYYGVRAFRTIQFGGQENLMPINWMVPTVWNAGCMLALGVFTVARLQRRVLVDKAPLGALTPLTGVVLA
jgi:hypothetical protein